MLLKNTLWHSSYKNTRKDKGLNESQLADLASLSRTAIRHIEAHESSVTVSSITQAGLALGQQTVILSYADPECLSDDSTLAASLKVQADGDESWKIYFMELVDTFRLTHDPRLLLLPPTKKLAIHLKALLASIVCDLSKEAGIDAPPWAEKNYFLPSPWFVSNVQSLKATCILESPYAYRKNNIFVQGNFLSRK